MIQELLCRGADVDNVVHACRPCDEEVDPSSFMPIASAYLWLHDLDARETVERCFSLVSLVKDYALPTPMRLRLLERQRDLLRPLVDPREKASRRRMFRMSPLGRLP